MYPKCILLLVLIIVGLKSKSQTLLNHNLSEINKVIVLHQGKLVNKSLKKANFSYSIPPEGNDCIFRTTCYFTSNHKCFKYINEYWGDQLPNQEINKFKMYYPSLKKINDQQLWVDHKKGFQITLINDKKLSTAYSLKIEIINGKSEL
ncbi:hypothetical protein JN11_00765 [Mucilaginibacter frigoritolerans]|uniref:Uncharacterized protein n=1 Tax=Mucilaginibacter frigoritolerans TaxID=652788 RepID=A0A562UBV0_9SPHI|nr:hypothetical protein [Mucilaginibacter frigoritolerans]TWJ03228.1 hypothetical protein JN11_00765 [Mucilaginibacter frigoritolerans]